MKLSDALKEKMFDVRLRDRLVAEGKITGEQLEQYLQSLPDDGQKYITISNEDVYMAARNAQNATEPRT